MKRPVRLAGLLAVALGIATVAGLPLARGATTAHVEALGMGTEAKRFAPDPVTIQVGDTVEWTNGGGTHNVHFDDGSLQMPTSPSSSWPGPVSKQFDVAGTYTYRCDLHDAQGMVGSVIVGSTGTPSPSPTATPTPTPTPTSAPPPSGGDGTAAPPAPELRSVRVLRDHFCTRRSRTCRRPGVVLAIDLSAPAAVRGALQRAPLRGTAHYRGFGTLDFGQVAAGRRQLAFSRTKAGRRLSTGRYRLALEAAGTTRTLRFRVRPS